MANLGLPILNTGQTMMTFSKRRNVLVVDLQSEDAMDGTGYPKVNTKSSRKSGKKRMYKPLPDGLTIKESNVQGLGLFATRDFDSEVVLGIVHILNKNFPHGSIRTALGAFYNHSDNPNCKNVSGFWHQLPVKYLITTKPIKSGDELTAKYTLYNDFSDKWE